MGKPVVALKVVGRVTCYDLHFRKLAQPSVGNYAVRNEAARRQAVGSYLHPGEVMGVSTRSPLLD